jgi:L-alanine-DL-glutamate epimerase-like enolase superfamily enzyme
MFAKKAVDVIMPDLAKAGGIAEGKRIADIADAHYIPIAPHNVSSPLGMMAACHVMASVPNFLLLEFHALNIPWWNDMCDGDSPFIENGFMKVCDRPGIGVELNPKIAQTLLWNGDTYFD